MAKKTEEKIRVHNQGKRTIDYFPDPVPETKNKNQRLGKRKVKLILPGRAVTMDGKQAKKYLAAYPHDLINFDSMVSDDTKDLGKENVRLESENSSYLEKIETLDSEKQALEDKVQKFESNADPDVQVLQDRITELEKDLEEATKPEETDTGQDKKEATKTPEADSEVKTDAQEKAGQDKKE